MNYEISSTQFGKFKRSALPEQICDRFLSLIEEGQIRPGQKLPPERELAAVMGVSRPCLREALRALALMNVLEMRQGDGTYVTSLEPSLLIEHLDFVFSLDDSLFLQLFQARKVLEPGIAAIAAREISEEEIADLWACLDKALENIEDREVFLQTDLELHTAIAVAARNPILSRFMQVLSRLGAASRRRTVELPGIRKQSLADHRAIVMALDARDPEAARRAMLLHLENVERRLETVSAQSGRSSISASQQ